MRPVEFVQNGKEDHRDPIAGAKGGSKEASILGLTTARAEASKHDHVEAHGPSHQDPPPRAGPPARTPTIHSRHVAAHGLSQQEPPLRTDPQPLTAHLPPNSHHALTPYHALTRTHDPSPCTIMLKHTVHPPKTPNQDPTPCTIITLRHRTIPPGPSTTRWTQDPQRAVTRPGTVTQPGTPTTRSHGRAE